MSVTTLTWKDLPFETSLAFPVATMQFAAASEQRDGVALLHGESDRMSDRFISAANIYMPSTGKHRKPLVAVTWNWTARN
jgi:hypothetical protein